jgi:hypothetical protein
VLYYHLDVQSTTPAPVYILYREGEDTPVQDQLDIIETLPGEKGYNDFRQVWKVWVPKDYIANTITDASMLQQTGYKTENTDKLLNMAVVPDKSRARTRFNGGNPELQRAWYQGQVAKFFLLTRRPYRYQETKFRSHRFMMDSLSIRGNQAGRRSSAPTPTPSRLTTWWAQSQAKKPIRHYGSELYMTAPLAPQCTTSRRHRERRWSLPKCC